MAKIIIYNFGFRVKYTLGTEENSVPAGSTRYEVQAPYESYQTYALYTLFGGFNATPLAYEGQASI